MDDLRKKLQQEIETLEYELRVELPKEILKARAHGDLSENAEFHAAKERQRFVDARLVKLKLRLAELSLVDPATSDVIGPNRRVIVFIGMFSGFLLGAATLLIRSNSKGAFEQS